GLTNEGAFTLFRSHKKKSELDDALEILNYLETTSAHHLRALFEKGLLYFEKADYSSAMACFRKCSSGDFSDASLYWQAKTYERLGEEESSQRVLLTLQTQFPLSYYSYRAYSVTHVLPAYRFEEAEIAHPANVALPPRLQTLLESSAYDDAFHEFKTFYRHRTDYRHSLTSYLMDKGEYFYVMRLSEPTANVNITYPRPYFKHIETALSSNTLDPYLVTALMREESNFNSLAVSSSGARGLMQLMPFVAKDMAKRMNIETYDLFVPTDNMVFGLAHLKYDVQSLGILKGIAAYNAGIGAVNRMRKIEDIDLFAENIPIAETNYYVKKVLRSYWIYKLLYDNQHIAQF
ncbi:MAG: lytic transglycosylase domain-containing protein, partial [Candidatus Margulisiibacteriota bacterium]